MSFHSSCPHAAPALFILCSILALLLARGALARAALGQTIVAYRICLGLFSQGFQISHFLVPGLTVVARVSSAGGVRGAAFCPALFLDDAAMALLSSLSEEPYFVLLRAGQLSSFGPDSCCQPFRFC